MNISPINFLGYNNLNFNRTNGRVAFKGGYDSDTCSFSTKKRCNSKEEVLKEAEDLKELMEDSYGSITAESTLAAAGVTSLFEDYDDNKAYMALDEEEGLDGKITGRRAVFEGGKVLEILQYKRTDDRCIGDEIFRFDTKTGKLVDYKANLKEGYYSGLKTLGAEKTKVEYKF